jgi:hypothetical protein
LALFLNPTFEFLLGLFEGFRREALRSSVCFFADLRLENKGVSKVEFIIVVGGDDLLEDIFSFQRTLVVILDLGKIDSNAWVVTVQISLKHCENICRLAVAVHLVFVIDNYYIQPFS